MHICVPAIQCNFRAIAAGISNHLPTFPNWQSVLMEWTIRIPVSLPSFLPWLLAAPKKKTTHRKKVILFWFQRYRMATKWLKPMKNIQQCPVCNHDKLMHHLCRNCLRSIMRPKMSVWINVSHGYLIYLLILFKVNSGHSWASEAGTIPIDKTANDHNHWSMGAWKVDVDQGSLLGPCQEVFLFNVYVQNIINKRLQD